MALNLLLKSCCWQNKNILYESCTLCVCGKNVAAQHYKLGGLSILIVCVFSKQVCCFGEHLQSFVCL